MKEKINTIIIFFLRQLVKMFVQNIYLRIIYNIYRQKRIMPNLVLFADAHHNSLPSSMWCMRDEMSKRGYDIKEFCLDYQRNPLIDVMIHMTNFMKYYAQAKYVFICDYFVPVSSGKKRNETKVVQLWHSCGAFKKFGYSTTGDIPSYYKGNLFKNYDLITVSSPNCVCAFASAMNCPEENVRPIGVSRTDMYFNQDFEKYCLRKFNEYYPELLGKKIILWAPTFRGHASNPYVVGKEAIDRLEVELGDEWAIITRLHPHHCNEAGIEYDMSTNELLPIVDLLITDYSSIVFDYSLFLKPIILFAPDYSEYSINRGFYLDYHMDIPARVVTDDAELLHAVVSCEEEFDKERMLNFKNTYMSSCDGKAVNKIFSTIQIL